MKHKKLIIALSVIVLLIGGFFVNYQFQSKKYDKERVEYYVSGIKMVRAELEEYKETKKTDLLKRIGTDLSSLYDAIGESEELSEKDYIKETMLTFANKSIASPSFLRENIDELISIMKSIEKNPSEEYPYSRIQLLLNSVLT